MMSALDWLWDNFHLRPPRRRRRDDYPETVAEVLDDDIKYRESVCKAMKRFREKKPWTGGKAEMQRKIRELLTDLSKCYKVEEPQIVFVKEFHPSSCFFPVGNLIILEEENDGRYSIVTFLHEFGHVLGKNEKETCRWSINLFRKFFPKSYAKLKPRGHLLYRAETIEKLEEMQKKIEEEQKKEAEGEKAPATETADC